MLKLSTNLGNVTSLAPVSEHSHGDRRQEHYIYNFSVCERLLCVEIQLPEVENTCVSNQDYLTNARYFIPIR